MIWYMLAKYIHTTSQIYSLAPEGHFESSYWNKIMNGNIICQINSLSMKHENKLKGVSLEREEIEPSNCRPTKENDVWAHNSWRQKASIDLCQASQYPCKYRSAKYITERYLGESMRFKLNYDYFITINIFI